MSGPTPDEGSEAATEAGEDDENNTSSRYILQLTIRWEREFADFGKINSFASGLYCCSFHKISWEPFLHFL